MADPNKIRLSPINFNEIVLDDDVNSIALECDPFVPSGFKFPPQVTPLGGSDLKPVLDNPDRTTG